MRNLTVRKYGMNVDYNREVILDGIGKSGLVFGKEFGIIQTYDTDNPDRTIRALCGLVGEKDLVLLDKKNRLRYLRIKHALKATLMVEFLNDPDTGSLNFLLYGSNQGYPEFCMMLEDCFEIFEEPRALKISDIAARNLCEKFFTQLYQVVFDPLNQQGWGTINAADFKSKRGRFIDPNAKQMLQVQENKAIIIRSFKSMLDKQRIEPLNEQYTIMFNILKNRSGIKLAIPELKVPAEYGDLEYELVVYDFARQTYNRIIGVEDVYQPPPRNPQLSLFG